MNDLKQIPKSLYVFIGINAPIIFFVLFLVLTNTVCINIKGFAIDNSGKLYIGKYGEIDVYDEDVLVKKILLMTSKGYAFTVEDNELIVTALSKKYILDLDGNIVRENDDVLTQEYNELYKKRKEFISEDGTLYKSSNFLGYYKVSKVSESSIESVYEMPVADYIVKIILAVEFLILFTCIPLIVYKWVVLKR